MHQPVKQTGVQTLGQGISSVDCLLHVELNSHLLLLPSPLAVHDAASELVLESFCFNPQKVGWELQDCEEFKKTVNSLSLSLSLSLLTSIVFWDGIVALL